MEPDYLLDSEVFYFQPCLYPMKYLHPRSIYTLPCEGVQRGGTPSAGSGGPIPPAGGSWGKQAPSGGLGEASPDGGLGAKPLKEKFQNLTQCLSVQFVDSHPHCCLIILAHCFS